MQKSIHSGEYQTVMRKLIELRKKAGLTQRQLADRLEREQSFVWRIETGERRLDVVEFYWVCKALGANADSVYSELVRKFRSIYPLPDTHLAKVAEKDSVGYNIPPGKKSDSR